MVDLDTLSSLCKRRGFMFPGSEIYGGIGGFWDYGPLGVELKRNVKDEWWRSMVQQREEIVGMDSAIVMNPRVWEASGHLKNFIEPLVDCKDCKMRWREDQLETESCPNCGGQLTEARWFNTMFKTYVGPVEDESSVAYLRPETAQGIFVNFRNVLTTSRKKLPFGIAQIGKAFRNEITPGRYFFRSREFEQMELEYFVRPEQGESQYHDWIARRHQWYLGLGIRSENLRLFEHPQESLAHYSKGTTDVEYKFPFGWGELEGIAYRGDFDLKVHGEHSGEELSYFDEPTKTHFLPHIVEPSAGVDRSVLCFLLDSYHEEPDKGGTRVVLKLDSRLAPVKVAILPLSRKAPLVERAQKIAADLRKYFITSYDDAQSIGRRYRRQDETGTPYCVTIDFQSLEDHAVTVRDRDSMSQIRVSTEQLAATLKAKLSGADSV